MTALPRTESDDVPLRYEPMIEPEFISHEEGERLLDEQARKYLGISGPEFRCKVRSGELADTHDPNFMRVWFLLDLGVE